MKILKMSLANMRGKMSRLEMRNIIAGGSSSDPCDKGNGRCDAFACYKPGVPSGICKTVSGACSCASV